MEELELHEKLQEAESYIERQREYIGELLHEITLLYGRLNMIRDLTEREIK